MFQSRIGSEENKKIQRILITLLIAIICGFFIYKKISAPDLSFVDGVYHNACCADVIIKDKYLSQGNRKLAIKVLDMKFGLTGYVKGRFTKEGLQVSDEEAAISFFNEGGKRALSLPINRHDYTFVSAVSAGAR